MDAPAREDSAAFAASLAHRARLASLAVTALPVSPARLVHLARLARTPLPCLQSLARLARKVRKGHLAPLGRSVLRGRTPATFFRSVEHLLVWAKYGLRFLRTQT